MSSSSSVCPSAWGGFPAPKQDVGSKHSLPPSPLRIPSNPHPLPTNSAYCSENSIKKKNEFLTACTPRAHLSYCNKGNSLKTAFSLGFGFFLSASKAQTLLPWRICRAGGVAQPERDGEQAFQWQLLLQRLNQTHTSAFTTPFLSISFKVNKKIKKKREKKLDRYWISRN